MGQKVHPYGFRLGVNNDWKSRWYLSGKSYARVLHEDLRLRKALFNTPEAQSADISDVEIIRKPKRITLLIQTARPGYIIGSKGANIERLQKDLQKLTTDSLNIKIKEVKRPEASAQIVALNIARQLRGRGAFRRTLKMALAGVIKQGNVQGVKIKISGRLGGADMARALELKEGRVPLHTLRANIDYGFAESLTTYGIIGVKVWICLGEIYKSNAKEDAGNLVRRPSDSVE
ncbi:30S ribosomal protein S3 [Candidatus Haliotispira prima]|uniref:Small ribosomal subunit protein uS3 n=1 Tax=Candidatus Haliotispira prima TaxID=3034016 RepID=A0ABY8MG57_9SPIO|nr:30S ribosomal protein S3 [Candidatus Haliotispira prima]